MSPFTSAAHHFDKLLLQSKIFQQLGYESRKRELVSKTELDSKAWHFNFFPCNERRIEIWCCDGGINHFFVVEIFNEFLADSFLLDEWSPPSNPNEIHPHSLSAYSGDLLEKRQCFVGYLEQQFRDEALNEVLCGKTWKHIPF